MKINSYTSLFSVRFATLSQGVIRVLNQFKKDAFLPVAIVLNFFKNRLVNFIFILSDIPKFFF